MTFLEDKIVALKISDECISCGACQSECPNSAISEGDSHYVIDAGKCTECDGGDPKCSAVCPVEACTK